MQFNGDTYGAARDALIDSMFVNNNWDEDILPPPPDLFLLDDSGEELLDDSGVFLLT
jgi:hypothetical protein